MDDARMPDTRTPSPAGAASGLFGTRTGGAPAGAVNGQDAAPTFQVADPAPDGAAPAAAGAGLPGAAPQPSTTRSAPPEGSAARVTGPALDPAILAALLGLGADGQAGTAALAQAAPCPAGEGAAADGAGEMVEGEADAGAVVPDGAAATPDAALPDVLPAPLPSPTLPAMLLPGADAAPGATAGSSGAEDAGTISARGIGVPARPAGAPALLGLPEAGPALAGAGGRPGTDGSSLPAPAAPAALAGTVPAQADAAASGDGRPLPGPGAPIQAPAREAGPGAPRPTAPSSTSDEEPPRAARATPPGPARAELPRWGLTPSDPAAREATSPEASPPAAVGPGGAEPGSADPGAKATAAGLFPARFSLESVREASPAAAADPSPSPARVGVQGGAQRPPAGPAAAVAASPGAAGAAGPSGGQVVDDPGPGGPTVASRAGERAVADPEPVAPRPGGPAATMEAQSGVQATAAGHPDLPPGLAPTPLSTAPILAAAGASLGGLAGASQPVAAPSPLPLQPAGPVIEAVPLRAVPIEIGLKSLNGVKSFEMRLEPPELGRVEVRLDIDEGGSVRAQLVVDRAETLGLLHRETRSLERALEQAGLRPGEGGIDLQLRDPGAGSGGGRGGAGDGADDRRARAPWTPPRTEAAQQAAEAAGSRTIWRGTAGIDLRI